MSRVRGPVEGGGEGTTGLGEPLVMVGMPRDGKESSVFNATEWF